MLQWDAEVYFSPALEDDALLFGFEEDDDFEEEEESARTAAAAQTRGAGSTSATRAHMPGAHMIPEAADPSTMLAELQARTHYLLAQVPLLLFLLFLLLGLYVVTINPSTPRPETLMAFVVVFALYYYETTSTARPETLMPLKFCLLFIIMKHVHERYWDRCTILRA
jgi:hypothetical protein